MTGGEIKAGRAAMPAEPIRQEAARALMAALETTRIMLDLLVQAMKIDTSTSMTLRGRHRDTGLERDMFTITIQQCLDEADAALLAAERRTC